MLLTKSVPFNTFEIIKRMGRMSLRIPEICEFHVAALHSIELVLLYGSTTLNEVGGWSKKVVGHECGNDHTTYERYNWMTRTVGFEHEFDAKKRQKYGSN